MKKRILAIVLAAFMSMTLFVGCGAKQNNSESSEIKKGFDGTITRIAGLKGPTSMGMVKLMEDNENKTTKHTYKFEIFGTADEVTPKILQGECDVAAIPVNLASVLYNKTGRDIQILAVNTLGVLYVVSKGEEVSSIAELKGKTIYATGKGSTPEYTLRYILQENGLDPDKDVKIEFKSEPAEIVSVLSTQDSGIAMLPQPYVTVAQNTVEGLTVALNLTEEWDKLVLDSSLITGALVARSNFIKEHEGIVSDLLEEYKASTEYVNANVEEAAALVEKYGIVKAAVAQKAIPECNITFINGPDMKKTVSNYLQVLYDQNKAAIGGTLPGNDFYYEK